MAYLGTGKVADAERTLQWSLTAGDESGMAYNGLGMAAIQKQDIPAARAYFEKAVHRNPDLLEALLNLGRAYKILGNTAQARACFERARDIADAQGLDLLRRRSQDALAQLA